MAITRKSTRTFGQFVPSGTVPKVQPNNNTFTLTPAGAENLTTLRMRTDIELYVVAGGGTAGVDLSFAYETLIAMGVVLYKQGAVTSSNTPLTDANLPAVTGLLGQWGQWEYLYPDIQFVNVNVPQLVLVTWRPRLGTVDTQLRRAVTHPDGIDVWMPWEIQDGSGLINTTDANGNTYRLGARFAQALFYESKT